MSGHPGQAWTGPVAVGGQDAAVEGAWRAEGAGREPPLAELLDDPIMALLWRGDRLEPRSARATVLGLREVLRRRNRHLEPLEA